MARGRRTVLTFGVYDMFHVGHLNLLESAKKFGDYLVVGVGSDKSVEDEPRKKLKTVIPEDQRLKIIQSLKCVDEAFIYTDYNDLNKAIVEIDPDIYVRGSDWREDFPGENSLKVLHIPVAFVPYTEGISSTKIKEKLCSK